MAGRETNNGLLLWIGGVLLATGVAVVGGFWVYALVSAPDMPLVLLAAILAVLVGLAVLLAAAIRDRISHKRDENLAEVEY